jgi:hypothetical protein
MATSHIMSFQMKVLLMTHFVKDLVDRHQDYLVTTHYGGFTTTKVTFTPKLEEQQLVWSLELRHLHLLQMMNLTT